VDESGGPVFGFTPKNELVNGRGAMIGFFLLIAIELVTGKGLLGSTGSSSTSSTLPQARALLPRKPEEVPFNSTVYAASGAGPVA